MKRRRHTPTAVWVVAAAVAGSVFGIASGAMGVDAGIPDGFTAAAGVEAEYQQILDTRSLDLPTGVTFPATAPYNFSTDPSVIYEHGIGESAAYFYWQCAWTNEALNAEGSDKRASRAKALEELSAWESTPFVRDHFVHEAPSADGMKSEKIPEWVDEVVIPAQGGDLQRLREYFNAQCTSMPVEEWAK